MINLKYTLLVLLLLPAMAKAQVSVIQDSKGESTLPIGGGTVAINSSESSLAFSGGKGSNCGWYWGVLGKAKTKKGIANVYAKGDFNLQGNLGGFALYNFSADKNTAHLFQAFASASITRSQFKLLDTLKSFDNQIYSESFTGFKIEIGINSDAISLMQKLNLLGGIGFNFGKKDNSDELSSLSVATSKSISSGNTVRHISSDISTPFDSNQYNENLTFTNINVDIGTGIGDRFLLIYHWRVSGTEGLKPSYNPALGLYLNKPGRPLEVVAGIQMQIIDYRGNRLADGSESTRNDRSVINLVAGYNF
jgi:hypothetical protein